MRQTRSAAAGSAVQAQIKDRKALQNRISALRQKQKRDRQILLRDMVRYIRRQDPEQQRKAHTLKRSRGFGAQPVMSGGISDPVFMSMAQRG